jgi:cytochrome c biogenesis protein
MEAFRRLRFTNLGFRISYAPGPLRQEIRNLVQVGGAGETSHRIELTDHAPMILNGYRFYPTGNKGFAPTFSWLPAKNSAETIGSVNLPSYPLHEHEQSREWTPPGSSQHLWIMLQFDELILDPQRPSEFRLPSRHSLVLRAGERRYVLVPGDVVEFPEGRLTYLGLRGWMGYAIFFDWTIPWLLAACLVAVGALSTHYWRKFAAKPWNA